MTALVQAQNPPAKVGVIHIQNAIIATQDGQKAAQALDAKFVPKQKELEKSQSEIVALQDQLRKGSNTMSEENKQKLMRDIDQRTTTLKRNNEDMQAELEQEQNRLLQDIFSKLRPVLDTYAKNNAYTLILDVSNPQTNVVYISNGIDITQEVVALYDKSTAATSAAKPAATPPPTATAPGGTPPKATLPISTPKPPATAPVKKQPGTVK
jgi:outer membrane protein